MTTPMIIFVIAYVAVTIAYLFSETSGNFKRRVVNKIFLASMFMIYAIVETIRLGNPGGTLQIAFLIGVVFCYIGDILLLWSFTKGGISFAIGNFILFFSLIKYLSGKGFGFGDYWYFLIILAVMLTVFVYLVFSGWYDIKGFMKYVFSGYIFSVSLHGTLSLVILFMAGDVKTILLCTGLMLYMISDYFISLNQFKFKKSKAVLRCNSASYFIGLMLVALSFSF